MDIPTLRTAGLSQRKAEYGTTSLADTLFCLLKKAYSSRSRSQIRRWQIIKREDLRSGG